MSRRPQLKSPRFFYPDVQAFAAEEPQTTTDEDEGMPEELRGTPAGASEAERRAVLERLQGQDNHLAASFKVGLRLTRCTRPQQSKPFRLYCCIPGTCVTGKSPRLHRSSMLHLCHSFCVRLQKVYYGRQESSCAIYASI